MPRQEDRTYDLSTATPTLYHAADHSPKLIPSAGPDLGGPMGPRAPGLPPKGGLPPNPSIFISPQASHQLNPALTVSKFFYVLNIDRHKKCGRRIV